MKRGFRFKADPLLKSISLLYISTFLFHCSIVEDYPFVLEDEFSTDKKITKFSFQRELQLDDMQMVRLPLDVAGMIQQKNRIISIELPNLTKINKLRAAFEGDFFFVMANNELQQSSISFQDFNQPLVYKIVAEDDSAVHYTINIKLTEFDPAPPQAYLLNISGDSFVGSRLTGFYEYADQNFDPEKNSTYQWLKSNSALGEYIPIKGANEKVYLLQKKDIDQFIKFQVIPANSLFETGNASISKKIGPILPLPADRSISISMIGREINDMSKNSFVLLHNFSQEEVHLNRYFLGRSSSCNLENGWTTFIDLSGVTIAAKSYFLISRKENTLNADMTLGFSIGENDCIVLTNSSQKPAGYSSPNVIDLVSFGNPATNGEGDSNAPSIQKGFSIVRKGECAETDTQVNSSDFDIAFIENPPNSSTICESGVTPPLAIQRSDVDPLFPVHRSISISMIGREINGMSENSFILLHNFSQEEVHLNRYFLGRSSSCNLENGWTTFTDLSGVTIAAKSYFLISRKENTLNADMTLRFSIGENDCIALTNSSQKPAGYSSPNVIDFVSFGNPATNGEADSNAPSIQKGFSIVRKGECADTDTQVNASDFDIAFIENPPNSSTICESGVTPPLAIQRLNIDPMTDQLIISAVGNKARGEANNDYIVLYNPTNTNISLNGVHVGRDFGCSIEEGGWSEYTIIIDEEIEANKYFLISRNDNTLDADFIWNGSLGSNYCVVLSNSSDKPTSSVSANVIDFVAFGNTEIKGEGGSNADKLSNGKVFTRKGNCNHLDNNDNGADFMQSASISPKNKNSDACIPMTMVPPVPMPIPPPPDPVPMLNELVISQIGNESGSDNDYIVLYNPTDKAISLNNIYIGRDSGCNLGNGWTKYVALPDETIQANSYYMTGKIGNTTADFTWDIAISSNYCLVLSNSFIEPESPTADNVIDFVSFKDGVGEGGARAGVLSNGKAFIRKGNCNHIDRNMNNMDICRVDFDSITPKNSDSMECIPNEAINECP